jgi:hypothetical protein
VLVARDEAARFEDKHRAACHLFAPAPGTRRDG